MNPKSTLAIDLSDDCLRFIVELHPGETTIISWTKVPIGANLSDSNLLESSITLSFEAQTSFVFQPPPSIVVSERNFVREGEWVRVGVDRRKPSSESKPVRYRVDPFRWTSNSQDKRNNSRANAKVIQIHERGTFTCFFKNFPEDCKVEWLWETFNSVDKVIDVFCPRKRDKLGKPFGFVRFAERSFKEEEKLLSDLNKLWIGSYKIRASLPRFNRVHASKVPVQQRAFEIDRSMRTPEKSYKDVVAMKGGEPHLQGTKLKPYEVEMKKKVFKFEATKEEKQWLDGCFLGLIKEEFPWEFYGEEIRSESGEALAIRHLGDNIVILSNSIDKSTLEMIKDMDEWISHWFIWYRPWSEKDVCQRRKVQTRWYSVPAHVWTLRFFKLASVTVGSFVKMDSITENKRRLDAARVLIYVPYLNDVENQPREDDDSCWSDATLELALFSLANATEHDNSDVGMDGSDDVQSTPAIRRKVNNLSKISGVCAQAGLGDAFSELPTIREDACLLKCMGIMRKEPWDMEQEAHA
ncbi:hypothetical protein ACS0TY_022425 [Phlomoides rotata]